jgi:hypothetical protein
VIPAARIIALQIVVPVPMVGPRWARCTGEQRTREAMIQAFAGGRRDEGSYRQDNSFHYLIARA